MPVEAPGSPILENQTVIFDTVSLLLEGYSSPAFGSAQLYANDAGPAILAANAVIDGAVASDEISYRALGAWLDRWRDGAVSVGAFGGLAALLAGVQSATPISPRLLPLASQLRASLSGSKTRDLWRNPVVAWEDYDLISGPAGVVLTFAAEKDCPVADILSVTAHLAELCAQEHLNRLRVHSYQEDERRSWNFQRINTGLAHGVTGVAAALRCAAQVADGARAPILAALRRVCDWLVSEAYVDSRGLLTWLPSGRDGAPPPSTPNDRQAWCYGTPGIAWTLWEAARLLGDEPLREIAESAMRAYCAVFNQARFIDDDPLDSTLGFCHGAAGMLAIADAFETHAGMPEAAALGAYLDAFLIDRLEDIQALGRDNMTLLTGASGILLVLLARLGGRREWLPLLGLS